MCLCFFCRPHRGLSPIGSGERCPNVLSAGHGSSSDAIARRHLGAYHSRESAGAEAAVDAEVGQRRRDANGSARVELDLEGEKFTTEIVVVSHLTSEAILGLDFLQGQQASIDLATKTLSLKGGGCALPLRDPTYTLPPARGNTEVTVWAVGTIEVPPRKELEITASLDTSVEGV